MDAIERFPAAKSILSRAILLQEHQMWPFDSLRPKLSPVPEFTSPESVMEYVQRTCTFTRSTTVDTYETHSSGGRILRHDEQPIKRTFAQSIVFEANDTFICEKSIVSNPSDSQFSDEKFLDRVRLADLHPYGVVVRKDMLNYIVDLYTADGEPLQGHLLNHLPIWTNSDEQSAHTIASAFSQLIGESRKKLETTQSTTTSAEQQTIRFQCCKCDRFIKSPSQHAGKHGKCPGCGTIVQIPFTNPGAKAAAHQIVTESEETRTIRYQCRECHSFITFPARHVGKRGKCPGCGTIVQIPSTNVPATSGYAHTKKATDYADDLHTVPDGDESRTYAELNYVSPDEALEKFPDFDLAYIKAAYPTSWGGHKSANITILEQGLIRCKRKSRLLGRISAYWTWKCDEVKAFNFAVRSLLAAKIIPNTPGEHVDVLYLLTKIFDLTGHSEIAAKIAILSRDFDEPRIEMRGKIQIIAKSMALPQYRDRVSFAVKALQAKLFGR